MKLFFAKVKISFSGQKPWTIVHRWSFQRPKKGLEKRIPLERASQEEQNVSFIAPSSEELCV